MPNRSVTLFAILLQLVGWCHAKNLTLENTALTNWGFWGNWEYCPNNSFAVGIQLKVEGRQWSKDDTALNAIKLFCATLENPGDHVANIMSSEGAFGSWASVYKCDKGILTGFSLRSEEDRGLRKDDTAANNIRVICSNPKIGTIEGDGMSWGSWGAEQKCLTRQALCGISTQVAIGQVFMDDVGLNNVKMECCDIPDPAQSCDATDSWELIQECDNLANAKPLICKFDKLLGISTSSSEEAITLKNLGFDMGSIGSSLASSFAKLNTSSQTGHDWAAAEMAQTWKEQTKVS